ncbi:SRPBCC domain-containing protein [Polymorphospora rubra]|uniref:SRPBCC domain-containing protein n=1 Tax=Polymorphospora rubra TaxID=338584 RepID=UPI0033D594E0
MDLSHPATRVWRALTEPRLIGQWFGETDMVPRIGSQFQLRPTDMPGFNGPVTAKLLEYGEPRRLAMEWRLDRVQTLVIYEVQPTDAGSRLTLHQSCFVNQWYDEHREQLEETYEHVLTGRLPAVLDWLAFSEVDLAAPAEPDGTGSDADRGGTAVVPGRGGARRARSTGPLAALWGNRRVAVLAGVVAVVLLTVGLVALFASGGDDAPDGAAPTSGSVPNLPAPQATTDATTTSPTPLPRAVPPAPTGSPSVSPSGSPRPSASGAPAGAAAVPLEAEFNRLSTSAFGYRGEVTVDNPGGASARWSVTITLTDAGTVTEASGAQYTQDGRTVTFTGAAVPANGSARFRFDVGGESMFGPKRPSACTIDGRPCSGL